MIIIYVLLAILSLLIAIILIRTLRLKPTPAKTATIKLDHSPRSEEYARNLSQIIQVPTVSSRYDTDPSRFYDLHAVLKKMFPNVHRVCEKHDFNGSLLFKWSGKGQAKPIMLMSHHDVVEASGDWKHGPFSGDIDRENRIWGRGSVDTKASLFCIFTSIEELIQEGYVPDGDVYIASSCTEEWSGDGAPRTATYLKEHGIKLSFLIDEGGMILERPMVGVNGLYGLVGVVEKGYGDLKFIAQSNGGHASTPTKNSPLVRLGKFMTHIDMHDPFKAKFSPTMLELFRRLTPNMSFGMKVIFANMWLFKPVLLKLLPRINSSAGAMIKTTISFTTAKGSEGLNVLPAEAYVTGNMRFIHHQANDESVQIISQLARKYSLETEIIYQDYPCPVVSYESPAFKLIEKTAETVYPGVGICPYVMAGGTDAKYYSDVCENSLRFAPLYITSQQHSSVHSSNENIYSGALPMGVDFYKIIIKNMHI